MKTIKYILIFVFCFASFTSCIVEDTEPSAANGEGPNLAGFNDSSLNLGSVADGQAYDFNLKMEVKGPTYKEMTSDIEVTIAVDPASTAIEGTHFKFTSKKITLSASNNYLGLLPITMLTDGIVAPLDVAPVLILRVSEASGNNNVVNNGKLLKITLNYLCFSNLAGTYNVNVHYVRAASGIDEILNYTDVITETGSGEYRTGLIGHWAAADLGGTPGFTFLDVCNVITIPQQNLVDTYSNLVEGVSGTSSVDPETGVITMQYTVTGGNLREYWVTYTPAN
ncbi:hypothetical protein [Flavobacterium acetivorans]|uniref:hypothetical protein n=1 Tax=Flavobacterium acetivorans TaxID=2893883 RepID=UPI001E517046|nr:hypothetical protein [Flavobacterium sp. F-29]UFH35822.1 hypothetical protein LNP19_01960 [Flavobacterium sp. F-29]